MKSKPSALPMLFPNLEPLETRTLLALQPVAPPSLGGEGTLPAAATDADGDFVIVWQNFEQDGSLHGIAGQRYSSAGDKIGNELAINSITEGSQLNPAVAMDVDGDFVVTWAGNGPAGGADVYARRYTATGEPLGDEFFVNTLTSNPEMRPSIAMDAAGNFVVVWSGADAIYARRYTTAGLAIGDEFQVNDSLMVGIYGGDYSPAVAMGSEGKFVVAWHGRDPQAGISIFARRYSGSGEPLGPDFQVSDRRNYINSDASVATDSAGNFVVAWNQHAGYSDIPGRASTYYRLALQRYSSTGEPQGEVRSVDITAGSKPHPSVAMDADGDLVIAWKAAQQYCQPGTGYGEYDCQIFHSLLVQRYNASGYGTGWVSMVSGSLAPAVALDADGDLVLGWQYAAGIYARRYAAVPAVTASAFLYDIAPHRLSITFDENVSPSLSASDLSVEMLGPGGGPISLFDPTYDQVTDTAIFAFADQQILADGNYRLTIAAPSIEDSAHNQLAGDVSFDFFVLTGDLNGDRTVSIADFITLASNFNKAGATYPDGDVNYDGTVSISDFIDLASNFGTTLADPAALAVPQAAASSAVDELVAADEGGDVLGEKSKAPMSARTTQRRYSHHRRPARGRMRWMSRGGAY